MDICGCSWPNLQDYWYFSHFCILKCGIHTHLRVGKVRFSGERCLVLVFYTCGIDCGCVQGLHDAIKKFSGFFFFSVLVMYCTFSKPWCNSGFFSADESCFSLWLYLCSEPSVLFLGFLIVPLVSIWPVLVIRSGPCVKMNAPCLIHLSNRYSDQLNLRVDLILTKQDYSRRQHGPVR